MNRKQRRAAAKQPQQSTATRPAYAVDPIATVPAGKPGFVLRMVAKVMLSHWVLRRVRHPDVERILASVAFQVGRPEIARELLHRREIRGL